MTEILRVLSMEAVERAAEGLAVWEHLRGKVADNFQTWKQECKFGRHRREESRYRVVRVLECVEAGQRSWKRLLQTAEEDTAVRGQVVRGG